MTGARPYTGYDPTISFYQEGTGNIATQGLLYRYVQLWSDTATWGGDSPPEDGDSVDIAHGRHLLVDIESSPILNFIVVQGSLIFPSDDLNHDTHHTFDASYIMVNEGYLEIGTEDQPYMSKLTITMHGTETDPYLPVYGNKVIAVRYGQLEMHGAPR